MIDWKLIAVKISSVAFDGFACGSFETGNFSGIFRATKSRIIIDVDASCNYCTCKDIVTCDCDEFENPTISKSFTKKQFERILTKNKTI